MEKTNKVVWEGDPGVAIVAYPPFSVNFEWKGKSVTITLKNGEDILKLAEGYKNFLTGLGIKYVEETNEPYVQNLNREEEKNERDINGRDTEETN